MTFPSGGATLRSRRSAAAVLIAGLALLVAAGCSKTPEPAVSAAGFSVVLVTLDTTRADRIGAFGGAVVPTPRLDAVAREGVRFDEAISQVPLTLPAHASILTGKYPASHGVRHNGVYRLRASEVTLAERLREAGFRTAAFIGAYVLNKPYGTDQGFEVYDDIPTDRYAGGRDSLYEAQRTADEVNAKVFAWLDRRPQGRFFLWVHYYDPHLPYSPPETPHRTLAGTGYDREISYVDSCFGDLVDRLRRDGLLDRCVLLVVGDHGESLGEHRELSHGIFLYEGAIRVPMMIRAPGLVPSGTSVAGPAEIVDIAPTLLDLMGFAPTPGSQGSSLVGLIRGERTGRDRLAFAETLMPRIEYGWSELTMVRSRGYKFIQAPRPELYDLRNDPAELHNLVESDADRARAMVIELGRWVARTTDAQGAASARRELAAQDEARLRSLGYLVGDSFKRDDGAARTLPDPKDRIDEGLLLTQARDQLSAGQAEEALPVLTGLVRASPSNHLARTSRMQALVRLGRLAEAEQEARAALDAALADSAASPSTLEKARRALASILWMLGRNDEALQQYGMAVEMNQSDESAGVFGGILLGAAGGAEEAMRIVVDVLRRNPRDGMAMAAKFELEMSKKDRDSAYRTAQALAELRAGDADTLVKAGVLALDRADARLATRLFEVADERNKHDPDILGYLGTARLASGDVDGAEKALQGAKRLRPEDPRAGFYLGNIALLRGDETKARALYAESLRLNPQFIPPLLNLARWLMERRRVAEAAEAVGEALRRKPGDPEAVDLLQSIESVQRAAGGEGRR